MGLAGGLQSKGSNSRGKPYALMLLIAFGAALFGVVLVHKFREVRVCNLLLKRTDQDLHSFQLLFQRERDRSEGLEKSNEELKASLYLLRTEKMELDRRLLELQSTIDSLRDEQRIMNVALQEKQSEIKMLREKENETGNENAQVVALTQNLKRKEDELQGLRRRLESRGAVAAEDPSYPHEDSKVAEERNENSLVSSGSNGVENKESMEKDFSTSKREETETQKSEKTLERRVIEGEERQKQESLEDVRKNDGEESKVNNNPKEDEGEDSEAVENQRADKIQKSGVKLKTETGKYSHPKKIRGKRWRYIAKRRTVDNGWRLISKKMKQENNRNLDGSGVISTTHRKFVNVDSLIEKEDRMFKQEAFNSKKSDTLSKDEEQKANYRQMANEDMKDGNIKQNPGEEMELEDSKSEEKQEPEQEKDGRFNRESNSKVVEDVKEEEENKEETESEF